MGIVVLGAVFVDIKGYPTSTYIPGGRNVGRVEQVPGGVSRNVVEDIANVELRPTFVSLVDDTGLGSDVVRQLKNHKVNTDYVLPTPDGMGTWLAIFNNDPQVIEIGYSRLLILFGSYIFSLTYEILSGYLRGFGISLVPAILTLFGVCGVRIIWINTVFPLHHTFRSIMLVYPISLATTAVLIFIALLIYRPSRRFAAHAAETPQA